MQYGDDEVLAHFGIKGMRWGIRRDRAERSASKKPSEDSEIATAAKKKIRKGGVQTLSNQELRALVDRMNLEQQYSRLSMETAARGEKVVKNLLSTAKTAYDAYAFINKTGALSKLSKLLVK